MTKSHRPTPPKPTWAYAYEIVPAQAEDRLRAITKLLEDENSDAQRGARTWAARVVLEQQITHILVVSDSPEQDREVNRRLETELKGLNIGFSMTLPLAVPDDTEPSAASFGAE